jgi:alpha-amylase
MNLRILAERLLCTGMLALLAACGGGGGGASAPPPNWDSTPVALAATTNGLPAHWRDGVFMQIFVRAYKDSDGDGIGDLQGLISKLDYLQALGVRGLWLMPIHPSQDHDHGYAVTDYRAVAPEYGSLADLDALLAAAHARGMGVILDYVMNHSAAQHPAFINSASGPANTWRDWYVWQSTKPGGWSIYGNNPWYSSASGAYFAGFGDQMPDFNLTNPATVDWHSSNLRFWLNRGVDGFRFDAVGNLVENGPNAWENQPQNHVLMAGVQNVLSHYDQRFMVCEAPAAPLGYAQPGSCGRAFAFGYQYNLIRAAGGNDTAAVANIASYWQGAPVGLSGFASNHDGFAGDRLANQMGGSQARQQLAAATYLLQSHTPFIYYGEEIGMAQSATLSGDPKLRTPMSWSSDPLAAGFSTGTPFRSLSANAASANVAAEDGDSNSLLNFYRGLIALRNSRSSLEQGSYTAAQASGNVMSFQRSMGSGPTDEKTLVVFNYGSAAVTANVSGLGSATTLRRLWPAGAANASVSGGSAALGMPQAALAVFAVE